MKSYPILFSILHRTGNRHMCLIAKGFPIGKPNLSYLLSAEDRIGESPPQVRQRAPALLGVFGRKSPTGAPAKALHALELQRFLDGK